MTEIRKIRKISAANVSAFIYAVMGFVLSSCFYLFFMIEALINDHVVGPVRDFVLANLAFTFVLSLGVALAAGVFGWLLGFFVSLLYNIFAKRVKGIEVEVGDKNKLNI